MDSAAAVKKILTQGEAGGFPRGVMHKEPLSTNDKYTLHDTHFFFLHI